MKNRAYDEQPVARTPDDALLEERLTGEQMKSLTGYGTEQRLEPGECLFDEKSVVDSFYVLLEGEIRISRLDSAGETPVATHRAGDFTGQLAALAGKTSIFRARATAPSRVLEISSETFRRVAVEQPDVADFFISGLGRRMRYTQRRLRQQEKMAALGKLSAGLAHELNNPAAAARQAAGALREEILKAQKEALAHDERFTSAQRERLASLGDEMMNGSAQPAYLGTLERSDMEDEIADWLEDHGVEDGFELAPTLVSAGLDIGRLDELAVGPVGLRDEALVGAVKWLGATLSLTALADEVGASTGRISELVRAMKEYTHMDRTAMREVDVREGLESTLTILAHKLKKGVEVEREYAEGLPRICAHGGELNQVWTNIVDNAVDAMGGEGKLKVKTSGDEENVFVEIIDDGPGITREAKGRIFEPFFTTKGVGEGTGLGLDIVRRIVSAHGGEIRVDSKPGETSFKVRLPIDRPRREQGDDVLNGG